MTTLIVLAVFSAVTFINVADLPGRWVVTGRHWVRIACLALTITLIGSGFAALALPLWIGYVVAVDAL